MAIKAGRSVTFTLTLDSGGVGVPIPQSATVTAQLLGSDSLTPLCAPVPVLHGAVGSNWAAGLVVVNLSAVDTGGIAPVQCALLISVTAADGGLRTWLSYIPVEGDTPEATALFVRDDFLPSFRANRLARIQTYIGDTLSDDYLWEKLKAAEADAMHQLRVLFQPTTVFAGDPTQAELDALGSAPYAVEPAYDFEPGMWNGDRWGFIATRQKPILSVAAVEFSWAGTGTVFAIPSAWIRFDRKYGHIQFVPSGPAQNMPLSMYMMQTMGGGRVMPQMIRMRYTAGLENPARDYPDLLDLIQRMVSLRLLTDCALAASTSISADGLSQSSSPPDLDKMGDAIEAALNRIRDRIHGIRVVFA